MATTNIFGLTNQLVEVAESYILKHTSQTKIGLWLSQQFWFPVKFLLRGTEELLKPFAKWSFMSMVLLLLLSYIIRNNPVHPEITPLLWSICFYAPMALVMFSVPSTYVNFGVTSKYVSAVVDYLCTLNITEVRTVELIEQNLEKLHSRVLARITAYKLLVGASWAVFTLILNQQMNLVIKIKPNNWMTIIQENYLALGIFISITLLAMWIIFSYKRASDLLFKSLEFGLIDFKHTIQIQKMLNEMNDGNRNDNESEVRGRIQE